MVIKMPNKHHNDQHTTHYKDVTMSDPLSSAAPAAAAEISNAIDQPIESESPQEAIAPEAPPVVAKIEEKQSLGEKLTKKEEKQLKEYKLKVDGRERSVKLDLNDDAEVLKYLQKAEASDKRFQEAAEVRKAAMTFIDELKKNPRKVLSDPNIGVDLRKFAEDIMNEQIAEMEKSPEQREREKLQKELEQLKAQAKEKEDAWKKSEFERLQVEHERQLETEISAALDVGGLPKTARTVKNMAEMMMIALEHGIDLSAKDIAPIIKTTTLSEFKEIVNSLADDQLEDFLGKEVIGRLRKRNVAKAKAVDTASSVKSTGVSETKKASESKEPMKKQTIRDFLRV